MFVKNLGTMFGPSGGLSYHISAWRYRKTLWRSYCDSVENWLAHSWRPHERELIIFGSSAGWSLSLKTLQHFERITCFEPDPLARFLFRRRFSAMKSRMFFCEKSDVLPWFDHHGRSGRNFSRVLSENDDAAILFSNILGQVPLLSRARSRWPRQIFQIPQGAGHQRDLDNAAFLDCLKNRTWASYHDLFSTENGKPSDIAPSHITEAEVELDAHQIASQFFEAGSEVTDHETLWLSKGRKTDCALWTIRPHQFHVIGFVKNKP